MTRLHWKTEIIKSFVGQINLLSVKEIKQKPRQQRRNHRAKTKPHISFDRYGFFENSLYKVVMIHVTRE